MEKTNKEDESKDQGKMAPNNASAAFDELLGSVGNGGAWQFRLVCSFSIMTIFTAFHNLGAVFLGATPDFRCDNPYLRNVSKELPFYEVLTNFTTPWVVGNEGKKELSKCNYFDRGSQLAEHSQVDSLLLRNLNSSAVVGADKEIYNQVPSDNYGIPLPEDWSLNPEMVPCSSWIYDQSVFESTVVTEWNLVCDRTWLKSTIQSTYMMGVLAGAIIDSGLSDRFGRRPALLGCCFVFALSSLLAWLSTSLEMFLVFRFIIAAAGHACSLVTFVLIMETTGKDKREFYGNLHTSGWTAGYFLLFVWGYFIRDWRNLQLAFTVPMVSMAVMYWILPESPRWLMMQGRSEEGLALLEQVGSANGGKTLPPKEDLDICLEVIKKDVLMRKKNAVSFSKSFKRYFHNVYLLVKTPIMRRRSLVLFYSWFVVSMNYYGAAFSGENIGVSLHTMTCIGALFGCVVPFVCYFLAVRFGRRRTLSFTSSMAGCVLIAIIFVPTSMGWLNMMLAMFGRMWLGVVFTSMYFYSSELVPTNIRNTAIGVASSFARMGSAIGPFVIDLGGSVYYALPSTVFGGLSLIGGLLALLLPETSKRRLVETIDEIECLQR